MDAAGKCARILLGLALDLGLAGTVVAQPPGTPEPPQQQAIDPPAASRSVPPDHRPVVRAQTGSGSLPNDQGQIWREYDIRPFVSRLRGLEHPEQTIVDWVLRETGTELWFREPAGMLTAESDKIRVYHTPQVQTVVGGGGGAICASRPDFLRRGRATDHAGKCQLEVTRPALSATGERADDGPGSLVDLEGKRRHAPGTPERPRGLPRTQLLQRPHSTRTSLIRSNSPSRAPTPKAST